MKTEAEFWLKVDIGNPEACWLWTGSRISSGYGDFRKDGKHTYAHRYSLSLVEDLIPGQCVMHSCDNPPCVNPAHLRQGTHGDNAIDKAAKLRGNHGERSPFAKLTEDAVRTIKRRLSDGELQRWIADDYSLHVNSVSNIARGKTWKHV